MKTTTASSNKTLEELKEHCKCTHIPDNKCGSNKTLEELKGGG